MSTAQNRINYTFQKAKDRGIFTGSQEEFMANIKSDPEFADSVVNLTRESLIEEGVPGAEGLTNEKFFESIGEGATGPEKKKEDGSEESSADGSAEPDPLSQAIAGFGEIGSVAQENIDRLTAPQEPQQPVKNIKLEQRPDVKAAIEAGYNSQGIADARAKLEEARAINNKPIDPSFIVAGGGGGQTAQSTNRQEYESAVKEYERQLYLAVEERQKALYGDAAKERYGEYGSGIVDRYSEELKAANPFATSNLSQVRDAVRSLDKFIEENGGSEQVLVPYLQNLLEDLGFSFEERFGGVNAVGVKYPKGYTPKGENQEDWYISNSNLQKYLLESVDAVIKNRSQGGYLIDIPERIISREEFDEVTKRNRALIDNFELEENKRQESFRGEMVQMNEQIKTLSSEASQLASSIQAGKNQLTQKLSSIQEGRQTLDSMAERLSEMYDIFSGPSGATESDIQEYENLKSEYESLFAELEKETEEYNSSLEALNKQNDELSSKSNQINSLQEKIQERYNSFEEESSKRMFDMNVASYEMNRLLRQYSDNVLEETWTWYGLAGKSLVNGIEDVASGLIQIGAIAGAGYLEAKQMQYSGLARAIGLDSVANKIDSTFEAIDELVYGENVDFSEDGWLSASLKRAQSASTYIDGLSDMWGATTKEAIDEWTSTGLGVGIEGALRSLPAMLGGSFAPVLFFASSMDSSLSMMSGASFDGMSDSNKLLVATSIATAEGMLERLGMPASLKRSPFFREAVKRTVLGLGDDISSASFRNAIANELRSIPKTMLVNASEEMLTGGSQQAAQILIQELSDEINGENFFVNPETVDDFVSEVIESGTNEAFGSLLFGAIGEISTSSSTRNISDTVFEPLVVALSSNGAGQFREQRKQGLELQLNAGKIDQETFDREMADFDRLAEVVKNLPKDDNGGVAANKIQIRTLVELEMKKAMLAEQNTQSSQAKLAEIDQQISTVLAEAERTHKILTVQEESAQRVVYNSSQEGGVSLDNLTEQENQDLNQIISEFSEGDGDTEIVIHLNENSAKEAGLDGSVGGRYEGNTLHVNLKAVERNKIQEAKAGFSKLKGFSETLREELNHSLMTKDILAAKIETVRGLKDQWMGLIRNDKGLSSRVMAKEEVYRQDFLLSTEEGAEYARNKNSELTSEDFDAIENSLSESKRDELERMLADEVIQEVSSFASTGRIDGSALESVLSSAANLLPASMRNGALDKIGKSPRAARGRSRQTFEESLIALRKGGVYDKVEEGMKKRDSKGMSPAALPNDSSFTVRIQYPGVASRVYGHGTKIDKTFKGKWDFINYIRKLTKDGTVPFFNFELVSEKGNKPIDGYKISGWNFKNSFKPISHHEGKIALQTSIRNITEAVIEGKADIGFTKEEFDKVALETGYPLSFHSFIDSFLKLDLLISSGFVDVKMPSYKRKGNVRGESKQALESDPAFAIALVRQHLEDIKYKFNEVSAVDMFRLADVAKMRHPEVFKTEDVADSVVRNSMSLVNGRLLNDKSFIDPFSQLSPKMQEAVGLAPGVMNNKFQYFALLAEQRLKSLSVNGEIPKQKSEQVLSEIYEFVESMGDNVLNPSLQYAEYRSERDAQLSQMKAQMGNQLPADIESFSPVFDLVAAILSNGEKESSNMNRAKTLFVEMMKNYKRSGVMLTGNMIASVVGGKEGRRQNIQSQLSGLQAIIDPYINEDGSFDKDRFIADVSKQSELRPDMSALHSLLSGGKSQKFDDIVGQKIPAFALALMGVETYVPLDVHVLRAVKASKGESDSGLSSFVNNSIDNANIRSLESSLDAAIKNMMRGKSPQAIINIFKARGRDKVPTSKTDSSGRILYSTIEDFVNGRKDRLSVDETSNPEHRAATIYWLFDSLNRIVESPKIKDKLYEITNSGSLSMRMLGSKEAIDSTLKTMNNVLIKVNDIRKKEGKKPLTPAQLGQYFFVFGQSLNSSATDKDAFEYGGMAKALRGEEAKDTRWSDQIRSVFSQFGTFNHSKDTDPSTYRELTQEEIFGILNEGRSASGITTFATFDRLTWGGIPINKYSNFFNSRGVLFSHKNESISDRFFDDKGRSPSSENVGAEIKDRYGNVYGYFVRIKEGETIKFDTNPIKVSDDWGKKGWMDGKGGRNEITAFQHLLRESGFVSVSKKQAESMYKVMPAEFREDFNKSGQVEQRVNASVRNSSRLRKPAERAAKSHELNSVKEEILKNPENYISKQNIKEAKEKLAEMSNDDLVAIMTDDALGRLQNRNDDLGVLAAAELIQRKVDSGDVQGVPALIEELGKMGTTAGRLLRHFREMKRATPQGLFSIINGMVERRGNKLTESQANRLTAITEALMYHQNRLKELMERAIRGENVDDEIKQAKADLERAELELNNLVNKVVEKGWGEIGVSIMQGNLLTPMSQFTNVGANLANALIKIPVDLLAAPIDRLAEALGMNVERKHRISLGAYMYGLRRFGAGFVEAVDQIITGKEEAGTEWRVNRGFMPIRSFMAAWANNDLPLGADGKASASQRTKLFVQGTLGIPAEVMFRFLSLGDTPFRRMVEGFELYQAGINKGLEGEALKRFVKYPNREDLAYAEREGRKLTFQEETTASKAAEDAVSFFERLFARGFDWMPGVDGRAFGKFFVRANMPYVRTPANILYDTLTFVTPYVAIPRILGSIAKGDTHAASENLAKLIIGTTTMQVAAKLVSLGLISGAVEWDEDEEKNIAYDQFPPNSINVSALRRWIETGDSSKQEDDFFVGYNKLGVMGAIIGATVKSTTRDEAREDDPFSVNKIMRDAFGINAFGSIAYMMDQSFLQGMNNLISVISSSDADDFERQFERWYSSMFQATSSIVLPNSLSAYHRAEREYMPDTRITKDMPLAERLIKRMEYTIRDRIGANNMPIRVNWKGEPVSQTPRGTSGFAYQFFDIMKTRQGEADDVSQEIWRLYEETEELSTVVGTPYYATTRKVNVPKMIDRSKKEREAFERTGKSYTFLDDPEFTESSVYLSVEEINKAMELSGKERYALIRQLMSSREYMADMSNTERVEALNEIDEKFNGVKEIDENGNFRSHTLYLLDVMEQKYLEMKENE